MSQSTARQRRRTWHQAKFSNHWAPAEGHPWLWGEVSHEGKDLLLKASQEGLCGQPGGKNRALCEGQGGSGCCFSSKQCWGEGLSGNGMTPAELGGLEVTHCKPRWFASGLLMKDVPGRTTHAPPTALHLPRHCCLWPGFSERPISSPLQ